MQKQRGEESMRPRVGFMAVGLRSYWDQFPRMRGVIESNSLRLADMIADHAEVHSAGIVDSRDSSLAAGELLAREDVDILFVHLATYANSETLLPAVRHLKVPVVLLNVQPFSTLDFRATTDIGDWLGNAVTPASLPEMTNVLIRLGLPFDTVVGHLDDDPQLAAMISTWCKTAGLTRRLRKQTLALLGRPFAGMMDLNIDETNLFNKLGLFTRNLDWDDIIHETATLRDIEVADAVAELKATFPDSGSLSSAEFNAAGRVLAGLLRFCARHDLCAIASHFEGPGSVERDSLISAINPALSVLNKRSIACPVEADIKAAVALLVLKSYATAATLAELYSMDFGAEAIIIGHSGAGDPDISAVAPVLRMSDVFHGKKGRGYLTQFFPAPGPATLLACTQDPDGSFRFVAAEGRIVEGPTLQLGDTNCRMSFRGGLRAFVRDWADQGPTHHSALSPGHHVDGIRSAAKALSIPLSIVRKADE